MSFVHFINNKYFVKRAFCTTVNFAFYVLQFILFKIKIFFLQLIIYLK